MKMFSRMKIVPATTEERTRSRRFIRSYQARVIAVVPPGEIARDYWARCAAPPSRTGKPAGRRSFLLSRRTGRQAQASWIRLRRKFVAQTDYNRSRAHRARADFRRAATKFRPGNSANRLRARALSIWLPQSEQTGSGEHHARCCD